MRIIAGKYGGRRIVAPKNLPVRPTADRVKEALFNILNNTFHWPEVEVLDLYAGTGNISFEFASRGAKKVTSVDQHAGCVVFIDRKAKEFGMEISTVKARVQTFLERCADRFDIVFADPPYALDLSELEQVISTIFSRKLLNPSGVLVVEHDKKLNLDGSAYFVKSKKYGGSVLSFFENG